MFQKPVFHVSVSMLSMCVYTRMCLCQLGLCMCVWPREDAEMKVTVEEVLSYHKMRH